MNHGANAPEPVLADAFAAFTAAAGRLESSYQQLQAEVIRLRRELEERNTALTASLADNEKMRLALRRILDALPCGVIVIEPDEQIGFVNPEAKRLLGTPEVSIEDAAASLMARIQRCGPGEQEFSVPAGDKKRWLVAHAAGMGQKPGQTVLIIRDATLQREMEQEREHSRQLVALAEMSSVLAHEIRNPLGSMELLTDLLIGLPELSEEPKQWVKHLQAGLRTLSATVNNVLGVHAMSSPVRLPLQLSLVLRESVGFVKPLADQAGISLSLHQELGDAEIAGNANEIQQVILNLAVNAFRHTPAGGKVKVKARTAGNGGRTAIVEIADSGCGIAPENLPHIFEAGFSTTMNSPGLGLAVCRRIVQQHGGSISVESEQRKGAAFRMEFPLL